MLESIRADPCRFLDALIDIRQWRRTLREWKNRGIVSILEELSVKNGPGPGADFSGPVVATPENPPHLTGVLVIDAGIPRYDRDAGARSTFLYLQLLREMGYEVYFMPNDQLLREPYATVLECSGIKLLIGYGCGRWVKWLATQGRSIHHVILHRPNIARRYLKQLQKMPWLNLLYFAHDLRHVREKRQYQLTGDVFHKMEADYWLVQERKLLALVNHAYFFSAKEAAIVREWRLACSCYTIPLYPIKITNIACSSFEKRSSLLFVGSFTHQPNRDAVLWFAREVFPLVRKMRPDITWTVVGRNPPKEITDLAGNGIIVLNDISDDQLAVLYQSAKIVVAPLRFGAGVKGKVVEAMCMGTPVITTRIGTEGMTNIEECVEVADSALEMSEKILSLYYTPARWEMLRQRALRYAHENFSRQAAMESLAVGLHEVQSGNCRPENVARQ